MFVTGSVPLYTTDENGSPVVDFYFDVAPGAELLLAGFTLSWAAKPSGGRVPRNLTQYSQFPQLQLLLSKLALYIELGENSKLRLLKLTIDGLQCESLLRIYFGLSVVRSQYMAYSSLSNGIRPEIRLVFPYLHIKYAWIGPIWVEDVTMTCAGASDMAPSGCPVMPPTVYNVSTPEDILAAVAAVEGIDVMSCVQQHSVFQLTNNIRIIPDRWPDSGVFITSNITIRSPPGSRFVLDFGAKMNEFKLRAGSYVTLYNMVITNHAMHPIGPFLVPMWQFNMARGLTPVEQGHLHLQDTIGVIQPDEYTVLSYWTLIITSPQQSVNALAGWQTLIQYMDLAGTDPWKLIYNRIVGLGMTCNNITLTNYAKRYNITFNPPLTGIEYVLGKNFQKGPPFIAGMYTGGQIVRALGMPDETLRGMALLNGLTMTDSTDVILVIQQNITMNPLAWPPPGTLVVKRKLAVMGAPYKNVHLDFGFGLSLARVEAPGEVTFRNVSICNMGWPRDYTAETALMTVDVHDYVQMGVWPMEFNRLLTSGTRVVLERVSVYVSRQEIEMHRACYAYYQDASVGLPGALTEEMCLHILPKISKVTSANASQFIMESVGNEAYMGYNVTLFPDPNLNRDDLQALLEGRYPTIPPPPPPGLSKGGPPTGAIIGGVVGGCAAVLLVAVFLFVFVVRRSRTRAQEEQLAGLQAKQQSHLEELSKTNPLAQMILDHLAGKDPGVAKLVVAPAGTDTSGDCAADNSSTGGAPAGLLAQGQSGGLISTGESDDPRSRDVAAMRDTPVNIAASDLAAVFKHLTILGTPTCAADAAPNSGNSAGRVRMSPGTASPAGGSVTAAGQQPLSGFAGFTRAMVLRLQNRRSATGLKGARESERGSNPRDGEEGRGGAGGGDGGDGSKEDNGKRSAHDSTSGRVAASGCSSAKRATNGGTTAGGPPIMLPDSIQSPVLEELLRLSVDLAEEIDDNQLIVTDVVASGGFGTVYKGMWHNLPVAVKIVLFSTASVNRRIALQEAALSKSISHVNIIATYAVDAKPMTVLHNRCVSTASSSSGLTTGTSTKKSLAEIQEWRLYIIQEYADGGTLRRALDKGAFHDPYSGQPRLEMILDIAQGVAGALGHLHTKNIVHGDLNPKNVLLKFSGQPPSHPSSVAMPLPPISRSGGGWATGGSVHPAKLHQAAMAAAAMMPAGGSQFGTYPLAGRSGYAVKVADFGLSVKMENSHISGLRQGTPFYAAPELTTLGIFSRAADCYAYGVLLWELYWGRPIWVPDARAPGGYVQHEDFPQLPPDCPSEYLQLMNDCLQMNHLQRPSFDEVLIRLRSLSFQVTMAAAQAAGQLDSSGGLSVPTLVGFSNSVGAGGTVLSAHRASGNGYMGNGGSQPLPAGGSLPPVQRQSAAGSLPYAGGSLPPGAGFGVAGGGGGVGAGVGVLGGAQRVPSGGANGMPPVGNRLQTRLSAGNMPLGNGLGFGGGGYGNGDVANGGSMPLQRVSAGGNAVAPAMLQIPGGGGGGAAGAQLPRASSASGAAGGGRHGGAGLGGGRSLVQHVQGAAGTGGGAGGAAHRGAHGAPLPIHRTLIVRQDSAKQRGAAGDNWSRSSSGSLRAPAAAMTDPTGAGAAAVAAALAGAAASASLGGVRGSSTLLPPPPTAGRPGSDTNAGGGGGGMARLVSDEPSLVGPARPPSGGMLPPSPSQAAPPDDDAYGAANDGVTSAESLIAVEVSAAALQDMALSPSIDNYRYGEPQAHHPVLGAPGGSGTRIPNGLVAAANAVALGSQPGNATPVGADSTYEDYYSSLDPDRGLVGNPQALVDALLAGGGGGEGYSPSAVAAAMGGLGGKGGSLDDVMRLMQAAGQGSPAAMQLLMASGAAGGGGDPAAWGGPLAVGAVGPVPIQRVSTAQHASGAAAGLEAIQEEEEPEELESSTVG